MPLASFLGLPRFHSSVCIQYNTQKRKSSEKRRMPGNTYHVNDIRWTQGGLTTKYGHNKPESEFLTGQAENSRSCECLRSCLTIECSMMKSSTLFHVFECKPLPPPMMTSRPPDVIHMIAVPRPSPFFTLFHFHV